MGTQALGTMSSTFYNSCAQILWARKKEKPVRVLVFVCTCTWSCKNLFRQYITILEKFTCKISYLKESWWCHLLYIGPIHKALLLLKYKPCSFNKTLVLDTDDWTKGWKQVQGEPIRFFLSGIWNWHSVLNSLVLGIVMILMCNFLNFCDV